ncbi:tyrosine-protein kinase receptor [Elysia marginata]|uniref:Tyrosine-protein kinase receptor n=1 Tax=Elysia marginata TaxID=1093978 RepID=A0AAV4IE49_9GAST|nr:tyrosine-protein kinase receptor [Elysia marginata]
MQQCWAYNPTHRPTFKFLIEMLLPYMDDRFKEVSFFLQEVAYSDAGDDLGADGDSNSRLSDRSDDNGSQYDAAGRDNESWDGDAMWRKRWISHHPNCDNDDDDDGGQEPADDNSGGIVFPAQGPTVMLPKAEEEYFNLHYASASDGEDFTSAKGPSASCSPHSKTRPNPYLSSCPARISPSPSSPVSRSPVSHNGWNPSPPHTMGSSHLEEKSPLLLPAVLSSSPSSLQGAAESLKPPLAAMDFLDDIDRDEAEVSGADSEFEDTVDFAVPPVKVKDRKFRPLSGDAREPSERLRLLSDSSQAESWKSAEDSAQRSDRDSGTSQQFAKFYPEDNAGLLNEQATSSSVSPSILPLPFEPASSQRSSTPSTVKSSSSSSSSLPLSSQTVGHSEPLRHHAPAVEAAAELPAALIAPSQTQAAPPAIQPPFSLASLRPFVLPQEAKLNEDVAAHNTSKHVDDEREESVNSLDSSRRRRDSSSHSNSNTGSINSGSVDGSGGGSKDSSSSAGSHHRFAANGHGPFSRQAAALC